MEGLLTDIRYSIRALRKRPGFTLLVVLVLGFAIAANTSIFSIVNAVILKPLSFKDPNQLVWIWATRKNVNRAFFSIPNFIDTRDRTRRWPKLLHWVFGPRTLPAWAKPND
jgi:hypothetical protein